jgi:hypothetical protein
MSVAMLFLLPELPARGVAKGVTDMFATESGQGHSISVMSNLEGPVLVSSANILRSFWR